MKQTRASSVYIALECNQFLHFLENDCVKDNTNNKFAKKGTDTHKQCEEYLKTIIANNQKLEKIIKTTNEITFEDYINALYDFIQYINYDNVSYTFEIEQAYQKGLFKGHCDIVVAFSNGIRCVVDFKAGYDSVEPDCPQLLVYSYITDSQYTAVIQENQSNGIVEYKPYKVNKPAVDDLISKLEFQKEQEVKPVSGKHCNYCPYKTSCPKMQSILTEAIKHAQDFADDNITIEMQEFYIENEEELKILINSTKSCNIEAIAINESIDKQEASSESSRV
jgi:CRISPR/Cas system-associated exonuclease Cas4 (RecB family)